MNEINCLYIKYPINFLKSKSFHQSEISTSKTSCSTNFCFVQIYKPCGFGQFKMHGIVINVFTNVNQIQLVLPHLPYDDATIGVIL